MPPILPIPSPPPYEAVWLTTPVTGTPHADALQAANPSLTIHTCHSIQGATEPERLDRWRNCDRNIRAWWRANRQSLTADQFLFLEYDVFCNVDLFQIIPPLAPGVGIAAAKILSGLSDVRHFWPFAEIPRLPRAMHALACATAPLAVLLISRQALDAILSPDYDATFAADIFCEVRLPTIIRFEGFRTAALNLPHVTATPVTPSAPGIWHPVKSPVL